MVASLSILRLFGLRRTARRAGDLPADTRLTDSVARELAEQAWNRNHPAAYPYY